MPKPSIEFLNARRALKPASGGANQSRRVEYAPDYEPDGAELAQSAINSFAIWAEASRAAYLIANGATIEAVDGAELVDEIPF